MWVHLVVNDDIALLALPTVGRRNSTARGGVRIMPSRSATGQFWRAPTMGAEALGVGASFLPGGGMVIGGGGSIPSSDGAIIVITFN